MAARLDLVALGGSGASTPELVDAIAAWPDEARRPGIRLVLHGRSARKLRLVADACRRRVVAGVELEVVAETDLDRALDGADVVLVQVRVGGYDARIFDETFPRAFGIPGEETQGPGGFANACRTIPALRGTWERIAARAPQALVVNLTNPSGIVTAAMRRHVRMRVVSVCDAPVTFVAAVAEATRRPPSEVRLGYAGLNHAGFWVPPDAATGVEAVAATIGVDVEDILHLGAVPTPYLRFYLHPDRQLAAQQTASESRGAVLKRLEGDLLGQYATTVAPTYQSRRGAVWYALSIVPLLDALIHGSTTPMILGLPDAGVTWAAPEVIVELPTRVAPDGAFEVVARPDVPENAAALLARHARYEQATAAALSGVEDAAELSGRRAELAAALAHNPMVPSLDVAVAIVDHVLAASPR